MKNANTVDSYIKFYEDIGFSRDGLFKSVADEYDVHTVIYPGCSFHITPALYFPHVVFVDRSEDTREFFDSRDSIQEYVRSNKRYKRSSYIQYLQNDYTEALPLRDGDYDLLISLFAGGIVRACMRYVKLGGIVLSNNYHEDVQSVINDTGICLDAIIRKKGKKYVLEKRLREESFDAIVKRRPPDRYLRNTSEGVEYLDKETYFILKRIF